MSVSTETLAKINEAEDALAAAQQADTETAAANTAMNLANQAYQGAVQHAADLHTLATARALTAIAALRQELGLPSA